MRSTNIQFTEVSELKQYLKKFKLKDSKKLLVQVFYADTNIDKIKKIQSLFNKKFPKSTLIGSTTDGVIDGSEVYSDTKSVVVFTFFKDTFLKSYALDHKDCDNNSYKTGHNIAKEICSKNTKAIISFADGIHTNGEEFVNGISSYNSSVVLAGGLAADNGKIENTYVFNKEEIISNGAIGVSLSGEKLTVTTNYSFDWMPIGKKLQVTKSVKNRVYEIEGIPAVDMYAKYMSDDLAAKLPQVGIEFPLVFEKNGVDVGRAVLFKHDDGSLTFAGNIDEGTYVRFGVGNIENILKNSNKHVKNLVKKLKYNTETIFVYSCMARRRFMNDYIDQEILSLSSLGNVAGFFTYGEFFHSEKNNQLLNETMTILALSESDIEYKNSKLDELQNEHKFTISSEHALAHMANKVSSELAELNDNLEKKVEENLNKIYKQSYTDILTELPNRLSLIRETKTESIWKIIILVNIDDFTTINDFYGHAIGDEVLKRLASILEEYVLNKDGKVFKLPSDEFAILLNTSREEDNIEFCLKEIMSEVEKSDFIFNGNDIHVTITQSAAVTHHDKVCLANADMSLKIAKKTGKDYIIYSDDIKISSRFENNILMANEVKNAILTDNIIPFYQPIFDIKTGKVEKYESLVRLRKKNGDILSPYFFLEVSQQIKLYPIITEIMIDKTFSFFAGKGINFGINIAISDILNYKTREYLFSKIDEYKIASQLTIEIIETQELENEHAINNFIDMVYAHGAKIAIDDFGSGFANFEHMTKMRTDYLKIDGSLIKNIDKDLNTRMVVETIVVFANKLGKKTVAEFVSSKEIYDIVKELGIDYVQGYYLGEPKEDIIKQD
jgi:diguanylate cyclase (GGDEF)-like protein